MWRFILEPHLLRQDDFAGLRGRRGRFGTLLQLLECGIFGRTAVCDALFLMVLSAFFVLSFPCSARLSAQLDVRYSTLGEVGMTFQDQR